MKLIYSIVLFSIIVQPAFSQSNQSNCEPYPGSLDSAVFYSYDLPSGNYILKGVNHYWYNEKGEIDRFCRINSTTRDSLLNYVYSYDAVGNLAQRTSSTWNSDSWMLSQLQKSNYDSLNQRVDMTLSKWDGLGWNFHSFYTYEFVVDGTSNQNTQSVDSTGLYNSWHTKYFYDNGLLNTFYRYRPGDGFQIETREYLRDADNQLTELRTLKPNTTAETDTTSYIPTSRRLYIYDQYELLKEVYYQKWDAGVWVDTDLTVYHRKIENADKVAICIKGGSICVKISNLQKFIDKGATLGACSVNSNDDTPIVEPGKKKPKKKSAIASDPSSDTENEISIFPNPVDQLFTIHLGNNDNRTHTIDILDLSGKAVKHILIEGQTELNLQRGNLHGGLYIARFYGNTILTEKILFK